MSQSDFVSRGQALVAQGNYQEAVKVCRLGLLGRPTTVDGRIVLGQALLALGRPDEVLAEMRVALELDKDAVAAHTLQGEALLRKGDGFAAIAALERADALAPGDRRISALLHEAHAASQRPDSGQGALEYIGPADSHTKAYPDHVHDDGDDDDPHGDDSGTRPISIRVPSDKTPAPAMLAVGDRSITVEVDPELDGIELGDDFGDVAAPPVAGQDVKDVTVEAARQAIMAARRNAARSKPKQEVTLVLDDDELMDASETPAPQPTGHVPARKPLPAAGPGLRIAVRDAVDRDSGPIDEPTLARTPLMPGNEATEMTAPLDLEMPPAPPPPAVLARAMEAAARPTVTRDSVSPSQLANMLAHQPHVMEVTPLPPTRPAPNPRSAIAAALPTAAAIPMPGVIGVAPQRVATAAPTHKTMSLNVAQQQSADALDAVLGPVEPTSPWARANAAVGGKPRAAVEHGVPVAAADEPTRVPQQIDARIAAAIRGDVGALGPPRSPTTHPEDGARQQLKTGVRTRARSRLHVAMWIAIGTIVIGGGVFAGFQIRSMRLRKQIAAARTRATDIAKADTYQGWLAARDSLSDIVRAANTVDNRAALARANALLAYEFGDPEARAAVDAAKPNPADGLDAAVAAAYLALAHVDGAGARAAAAKALAIASTDPAALYVDGLATLDGGDATAAIASLHTASEHDPRALYFLGLARAEAAASAWDDAIAATTRALAASPELPAAVIASANTQLAAGRLAHDATALAEAHTRIQHVIDEGNKRMVDQPHGVSAQQLAFADLALARTAFAANDPNAAREAVKAAGDVGLDDQRFAEDAVDTLLAIGDIAHANDAAGLALKQWPASRRAAVAAAQIDIAQGQPSDAINLLRLLERSEPLPPRAQAVRGEAEAGVGDVASARGDFQAALGKQPNLEPAIVGLAWLDLAAGDVDGARKRIEKHYDRATASAPMTTVYAAVMRASTDPKSLAAARDLLLPVVGGPPTIAVARAALELARIYRDTGDFAPARKYYGQAAQVGIVEAKLETAQLDIDDRDPDGGREVLDELLKTAGDHPSPHLLLETARAHALTGDSKGAAQLLDTVEHVPGAPLWLVERERGRLALRRENLTDAAAHLAKALDTSGSDADTMLLAADAATGDAAHADLAKKVQGLIAERLGTSPEADIVTAKLALGANRELDAEAAYTRALQKLADLHAAPRRLAQANYGLGVIAYNRKDDATARDKLALVMDEDPSVYGAYLFAADIAAAKDPARAGELLHKAVTIDPDNATAWLFVGRQAQAVGDQQLFAKAIEELTQLAPAGEGLKELKKLKVK